MKYKARFPIRFDSTFGFLASLLLMRPSDSFVEIEKGVVRVRMAWSFQARFPLSAVARATRYPRHPLSRGVHGMAGRWLVNGSGEGIVSIELAPGHRARVLGVPVRLHNLLVSVNDPSGLLATLAG